VSDDSASQTAPDSTPTADTIESAEATDEAKPKRRRGWLIATVVTAVVLLAAAGGGAAWWVMRQNAARSAAQRLAAAEAHWKIAMGYLKTSETLADEMENQGDATIVLVESWPRRLSEISQCATPALNAALEDVSALPPSKGKTAYIKSITQARDAAQHAAVAQGALRVAPGVLGDALDFMDLDNKSAKASDKAIAALNKRKWSQAQSAAEQVRSLARKSQALARALQKESKGLDPRALRAIKSMRTAADGQALLAIYLLDAVKRGRARSTSAYNADVNKVNRTLGKISGIDLEPFYDPDVFTGQARPLLVAAASDVRDAETTHAQAVGMLQL
jgi:hypothetical protein